MFMWHINISTFLQNLLARGNKNGIVLSFARRRAQLNIQIKLTNFVKLLNCVSLKSSKNGLSGQWDN